MGDRLRNVRETIDSLARDERGQLLQDFLLGVTIFLITMIFVSLFIPNLLAPFQTPGEEGSVPRVERSADTLISNVLAGNSDTVQPTTLDRECTRDFFDSTNNPDCTYGSEFNGDVNQMLGLRSYDDVNVEITSLKQEASCSGYCTATIDGVTLERDAGTPNQQNVVSSTRIVHLNGEAYRFQITVW